MSEARDCVVKLVDDHGVEHSVRVRAESVYEAALRGLQKLERIGWESDGSQIGWIVVEIYEEPSGPLTYDAFTPRRVLSSGEILQKGDEDCETTGGCA